MSLGGPLVPLWEVAGNLVQSEPKASCAACCWRFRSQVRPALMNAGATISAAEAERRVLLLANPALQKPVTTPTVTAGFQMINPGEVAESHRHVQSALRVLVEGGRGYTAVNGERLAMERGDLILTPCWTWHDHENESDAPMIWLDGLDVPLMQQLSVSFYEEFAGKQVAASRPRQFSELSFGRGLVPSTEELKPQTDPNFASPALRYPYSVAREVLGMIQMASGPQADGYSLQYRNTRTGGHILPTMAAGLNLLPKQFRTARARRTDCQIILVLEGRGRTRVGDDIFDWEANDVIVVPNWQWHSSEADEEAVLFSFSDRALQEKIGIWRGETSDN